MVGGSVILYSDAGEVWGLTEEPYDTVNATDNDLSARCTTVQAVNCSIPFNPTTCNVRCIDFVSPGNTRNALNAINAEHGVYCPATRWAPVATFNGFLLEVQPFNFEDFGMPAFPGRWCIMTTMPRSNIYEEVDRVRDSNGTVRAAAIAGATLAILLMAQALVKATITASHLTRQNYDKKVERVTKAAKSITSCGFSVCFCRYSNLKVRKKTI